MGDNKKTAAKKTTSRARKTKTKGGSQTDARRKYTEDVKCSVDVGAKTRKQEEGVVKTGPATAAKFQKGGGTEKAAKSITVSLVDITIISSMIFISILMYKRYFSYMKPF